MIIVWNTEQNFIENFKLESELNYEVLQSAEIVKILELTVPNEIVKYFENIKINIKHLCSDGEHFYDNPNAYSCEYFSSNLIILCAHFPLWTSISSRSKTTIGMSSSLQYTPTNIDDQERINVDKCYVRG